MLAGHPRVRRRGRIGHARRFQIKVTVANVFQLGEANVATLHIFEASGGKCRQIVIDISDRDFRQMSRKLSSNLCIAQAGAQRSGGVKRQITDNNQVHGAAEADCRECQARHKPTARRRDFIVCVGY